MYIRVRNLSLPVVVLAVATQASANLETVRPGLESREKAAGALTFTWKYEYEYRERTGETRVVKGDGGEIKYGMATPGIYKGGGTLTIAKKGGLSVVSGTTPSANGTTQKIEHLPFVVFATDEIIGATKYRIRDEEHKDRPYVAEIASSQGGLKSLNPFESTLHWPHLFVFLCGESPIGTFMVPWEAQQGKGGTSLKALNYDPSKAGKTGLLNQQFDTTFDFEYQLSEDGLPVGAEVTELEALVKKGNVGSWKEFGGQKWPATYTETLSKKGDPLWQYRITFKLESVEPTAALELPIPNGTQVVDYRLVAEDLGPRYLGKIEATPVNYRFSEALPAKDSLLSLDPMDRMEGTGRVRSEYLMAGFGSLLVGAVVLRRKKKPSVAEQA